MDVVSKLTPPKKALLDQTSDEYKDYMKWFLAISDIQHPTFSCEKIVDAVMEWVNYYTKNVEKDQYGNIVVRIDANGMPKNSPVVSIQAHLDMVWVGEYVDGVVGVTMINEDGKHIIKAEKSTLGADDAFGLALMLEMIEKQNKFVHGPMEFIFTVDEEQGLVGAEKLPYKGQSTEISELKFKYLINCDSLSGPKVYVGSNGGIYLKASFSLNQITLPSDQYTLFEMDVSNLTSGHSGAMIHLGRASAIKLLARFTNCIIHEGIQVYIQKFTGGIALNAIPPAANIKFAVKSEFAEKTQQIIKRSSDMIFKEFTRTDEPRFKTSHSSINENKFFSDIDSKKIIMYAALVLSGPMRMSPDFPETVDSSQNVGVVETENDTISFFIFARSATKSKWIELDQNLKDLAEFTDLEHQITVSSRIEPWTPDKSSKLAKIALETFEEVNHYPTELGLLGVTIEPSMFVAAGYDADMISVCPYIMRAHSIGEQMCLEEAMNWKEIIYKILPKLID